MKKTEEDRGRKGERMGKAKSEKGRLLSGKERSENIIKLRKGLQEKI